MLRYLLPVLDILTAAVLVLHVTYGLFEMPVLLVHGLYLGFKGLAFSSTDFASRIDFVCSVYIILVAFGLFVNMMAVWLVFAWLMQKALFSLAPLQ